MAISAPGLILDDVHDRTLLENVHPPRWKKPEPRGRYNLVVLGAGTAGLVSAAGAAALGARVALIEKRLMGGDCTNYGCVPSKALIRSARVIQALRDAPDFGAIPRSGIGADFPLIMQRMRRLRARISANDSASRLTELGVDIYFGKARFRDTHTVEVDGTQLAFSKAIVATGGRPAELSVPGFSETGYETNETIFSLTALPSTLLVIGAGPIGCELAQTFRRFGVEVIILTNGKRLLPREEEDAAAILEWRFAREGIRLIVGAKLLRAEKREGRTAVFFDCGRAEQRLEAECVLVAVGRQPDIEGLGLEAAGVAFDERGIRVNDRLQTSNPDIYAVGDVCSAYKFTHAADAMARVALQNALFFGRKKASNLLIPWCTYTDPEVAHVGITETEARRRGAEIAVITLSLEEIDRAILDGETEGYLRLYLERRQGRLLGATMVGAHAGESIGEAVLAINRCLKVNELASVIHPYPTQADALRRAAEQRLRSRFQPWMKRVLERYFRFRR